MMTQLRKIGLSLVALGACSALGAATQTLTYTIPTVQNITINGNPTLTFAVPTAGQNFAPVSDATTTYSLTSNIGSGGTKSKITGALTTGSLPTGITSCYITMAVPSGSGGTSAMVNVNSTTAQDLLTGVNNGAYSNTTITYAMSANVRTAAVTSPSANFGVTFTLTSG